MNTPDFFQTPPRLSNQFTGDFWLRSLLQWRMPAEHLKSVTKDLERFGAEVAGDMTELAWQAEREAPVHVPFDAWGVRIDQVKMSPAWKALEEISAREGLVALGYERGQGEWSRLYQFAKLYLFHPSSAFYSCPLAMSDGAARILELLAPAPLKDRAFRRLTSRSPEMFWTSGQWMTEKTGGSDVSDTSTIAKKDGNQFRLYGTKYFTSSVTSQMAMALARIEGAPQGSKGLSLFFVETKNAKGQWNQTEVHRLKDKMGTKALPTAELTLNGPEAVLLGEPGQGVKNIATMLNITRLYNSVCSVAQMRRGLALVDDYAVKRKVFGRSLAEQPLHLDTFAEEKMQFVSALLLTMHVAWLLGKDETGSISESERNVLRLLTPLIKLYTGKLAIRTSSEVVEAFGGAGYMEDTRIPVIFRDAQVFPIWEGPTNVLSLDVLRVLQKTDAFAAYMSEMQGRISGLKTPKVRELSTKISTALKTLSEFMQTHKDSSHEFWQTESRALSFSLARVYSLGLLLEMADWAAQALPAADSAKVVAMARRWCDQPLVQLRRSTDEYCRESALLALS